MELSAGRVWATGMFPIYPNTEKACIPYCKCMLQPIYFSMLLASVKKNMSKAGIMLFGIE